MSGTFVRAAGLASAAVFLAACAPMPPQDSRPAATAAERSRASPDLAGLVLPEKVKLGAKSLFGTAMLNDGIFQCVDSDHPKANKYPDCKGIPVIVLQKSSGGCLSLVPYAGLIIHSERKRTKIIWQIYGPKGYEFAANGIELKKVSSGTLNPGDVYSDSQHQGDRFKWELKQGAIFPGAMAHQAHVVDPSGMDCEPIDPVAINIID